MGNCGHCGKALEGRGKYCGAACKQAAFRRRHGAFAVSPSERAVKAGATRAAKTYTLVCEHCGQNCTVNGNQARGARYCSPACKQAAYRERAVKAGMAALTPYMVPARDFDRLAAAAPKAASVYSQGHWSLRHDGYRVVSAEELAELVKTEGGQWVIEEPY